MFSSLATRFYISFLVFFLLVLSAHSRPKESKVFYNFLDVEGKSSAVEFGEGESRTCFSYWRNPNGYCNNRAKPMEGARDTAQLSYIPGEEGNTRTLQSARTVANFITTQKEGEDIFNSERLSDFTTFFGQFLDHNMVHTNEDSEKEKPITLDRSDRLVTDFPTGELPFKGSKRAALPSTANSKVTDLKRPVNCLPAAIDLVGVYSAKVMFAELLRTKKDGLLYSQRKKGIEYLPKASKLDVMVTLPGVQEPTEQKLKKNRKRFFVAGDPRANENKVLTSFHTLFLREHNRLARIVKSRISESEVPAEFFAVRNTTVRAVAYDELIFQFAKRLNEAQFQGIVALEYFPAMTGRSLVDDGTRPVSSLFHIATNSPTWSDVFTTAAFRTGHTMVGNVIEQRDAQWKLTKTIELKKLFFSKAKLLIKDSIEDVLRGAMMHRAQEIDVNVVFPLRNILFSNVKGLRENVDLLALNLQRGRDHGLPSYNVIREKLQLERATAFSDITSDRNLQGLLDSAYNGDVESVEAWVGLMAEDRARRSPMGTTNLNIWIKEFFQVLTGDRFLFTMRNSYHELLQSKFNKEVTDIIEGRRAMKQVIADNTEIDLQSMPESVWRVSP